MLTGVLPFADILDMLAFRSTHILSRIRSDPTFSSLRREQHFLSSTIPPLLLAGVLYTLQHGKSGESFPDPPALIAREDTNQCQIDSVFQNTCSYVREHCSDFDDGLIPYFQLFYCAPPSARPVLVVCLFPWLMVVIASMATVAGDFLSVHLGVIVSTVGISENLAGVTIFAFGNGSTDLFSTLAAMNANSGSLAIGELFGAAAFITTVVLGLVMMTRPFSVEPKSFVGEAVWFIIAASCLTAFLADGELVFAECTGIIGLYLVFVCYAILRPKATNEQSTFTASLAVSSTSTETEAIRESPSSQTDETTRLLNLDGHNSDEETDTEPRADPDAAGTVQDTESIGEDSLQPEVIRPGAMELERHSPLVTSQDQPTLTDSKSTWINSILKMFPPLLNWHEQTRSENLLALFAMPLLMPIGLTIPNVLQTEYEDPPASTVRGQQAVHSSQELPSTPEADGALETISVLEQARERNHVFASQNWTLYVQFTLGFQFLALLFVSQAMLVQVTTRNVFLGALSALILSAALITIFTKIDHTASSRTEVVVSLFISTFSFITSLAWIYLTATSTVSLLTTLGFILKIPNAILGATVFAIGNSSNDLVANIAVARRGSPVLAASACFGGPMMNMLLGIGIGGLVQILKQHAGGVGWGAARYEFELSPSMFVSTANLLVGLATTLIYAFCNSWMLDRRLGVFLVGTWSAFTVGSVAISMWRS